MKDQKGYRSFPLSINRRVAIASATVTGKKNTIHSIAEVDITKPRQLINEHFQRTGERLSLTAYIVTCLAHVIKEHQHLNSFIKGNRLYILDDVTVSVLIEREIAGEKIPEPIGIKKAQLKTFRDISTEIKDAKFNQGDKIGSLSGHTWINIIPNFFLKRIIGIADKNTYMAKQFGKVAVTAVGMFTKEGVWFIPHGSATVLITVGSISQKVIEIDGQFVSREHLCITASFDHNIVDGAPAARFMNDFIEAIKNGTLI